MFANWLDTSSGRGAYDKITAYIQKAKDAGGQILIGGTGAMPFIRSRNFRWIDLLLKGDDSKGYFVQPTVILTKDPQSITMVEEIFGPVITVRISLLYHNSRCLSLFYRLMCSKTRTMKKRWSWLIKHLHTPLLELCVSRILSEQEKFTDHINFSIQLLLLSCSPAHRNQ